MSPGLPPPNQAFDISLLNAEKLDSPGGLKTALHSIENICFQPGSAIIAGMILTLNSRSHILEYIFSGKPRVTAPVYELARHTILFTSAGREGI